MSRPPGSVPTTFAAIIANPDAAVRRGDVTTGRGTTSGTLRSGCHACDDPARVLVDAVGEAHRCVERVDGEESPLSPPRVRCNPLSIAKRWSRRRLVALPAPRTSASIVGGPAA